MAHTRNARLELFFLLFGNSALTEIWRNKNKYSKTTLENPVEPAHCDAK